MKNNVHDFAIVINKDKGLTSRSVVNKLCKIFNTKKIGHTGTLDPMASGVLVCLVGKYTKLVDLITSSHKEYIAEIKLGIKTDTLDITGNTIEENMPRDLDIDEIKQVLQTLVGEYTQIIPKYSAVHVNGKRLYEYARNNEAVELPTNTVYIEDIELLSYENNLIKFRAVVSKGTYIRSLIQSICSKLNVIGTMSSLIRTKQGNFSLDMSYTLEDIANNNFNILNLEDLLELEIVNLNNELYKKVINGNQVKLNKSGYILFRYNDEDIALYYFEDNIGKLKILFKNV